MNLYDITCLKCERVVVCLMYEVARDWSTEEGCWKNDFALTDNLI
jgi:hypothetical protein